MFLCHLRFIWLIIDPFALKYLMMTLQPFLALLQGLELYHTDLLKEKLVKSSFLPMLSTLHVSNYLILCTDRDPNFFLFLV